MPIGRRMRVLDDLIVHAPVPVIFSLARDVTDWPRHLPHYRFVRYDEREANGSGIVEMSANRPFSAADWPTWWRSIMQVDEGAPAIRFRHIGGITTGMDVEWTFEPVAEGTHVRILHVWNGPRWPFVGDLAARSVIGPVFVHGIASRTLAGLARIAESG